MDRIEVVLGVFDLVITVFFFKQKTAYEVRISDGSSDVCSSDLVPLRSTTSRKETPHAPTFASTSSAPTAGISTSSRTNASGGPAPCSTAAFIVGFIYSAAAAPEDKNRFTGRGNPRLSRRVLPPYPVRKQARKSAGRGTKV